MKVQTLSLVIGNEACNARCPFCVSKMTPKSGIEKDSEMKKRRLKKSAQFAKDSGVSTVLMTGKGEPTLFWDKTENEKGKQTRVTSYLEEIADYNFPFVELQTNGILLANQRERYDDEVKKWVSLGLTTVALSVVHYDEQKNMEIYAPYLDNYYDLGELIDYLHERELSVRLSVIMAKGYIEDAKGVKEIIHYAKDHGVEQLSVRPVSKPKVSRSYEVYNWTKEHELDDNQIKGIVDYLEENGHKLLDLAHGARVYDVDGQNVCLTNCLTRSSDPEDIRQLIYFPDGHLRYDWEYEGAILM